MTAEIGFSAVTIVTAIVGVFLFVRERIACSWPSVRAEVKELPKQSYFESDGTDAWVLNIDTDHFLIWIVDGIEYRKKLDDEASVRVGGLKIWRRAPSTEQVDLRYNPRNPEACFLATEIGQWKWAFGIAVGALVCAALAGAT